MRSSRVAGLAVLATLVLAGARQPPDRGLLPPARLAVRSGGEWHQFWSAGQPLALTRGARVAAAVAWRESGNGVAWGELLLAGEGEAWRTRVILLRADPSRIELHLANGASPGGYDPTWNVESAPDDALFAFNVGQFTGGATWGWVVHAGEAYRPPASGPLAVAVVIDSAGGVAFHSDSSLALLRAGGALDHPAGVVEGFQSYPVLVRDGQLPRALATPSPYINLTHRDARLALALMKDGSLLVALTRFDALGDALGSIPFGLTIPELAGLMASLGAQDAVALDGGLSAQLMVRDASGERRFWKGMRRVPLGLVAYPR